MQLIFIVVTYWIYKIFFDGLSKYAFIRRKNKKLF